MMTIYNLAGGDITKYDQVFEQPWSYAQLTRRINADIAWINYNHRQRTKSNK